MHKIIFQEKFSLRTKYAANRSKTSWWFISGMIFIKSWTERSRRDKEPTEVASSAVDKLNVKRMSFFIRIPETEERNEWTELWFVLATKLPTNRINEEKSSGRFAVQSQAESREGERRREKRTRNPRLRKTKGNFNHSTICTNNLINSWLLICDKVSPEIHQQEKNWRTHNANNIAIFIRLWCCAIPFPFDGIESVLRLLLLLFSVMSPVPCHATCSFVLVGNGLITHSSALESIQLQLHPSSHYIK